MAGHDESDGSEDFDIQMEEEVAPVDVEVEVPVRRPRGRPPGSSKKARANMPHEARIAKQQTNLPVDENGNPLEVRDDEVVLPEDPKGTLKVDEFGNLLGGREYRVRTFTLADKGERLFMLSTEPARCMGFRDSYLLFQKHRKLWKIILSDAQKFDLIEREILPHSYKGRVIGVVTARSIFKEFGAKIVVGGKYITDDYYEDLNRAEGLVEGQIADPDDRLPAEGEPYNRNQYVAWHGASSVYHQNNPVPSANDLFGNTALARREGQTSVTDENWMFEHAQASSQYNAGLTKKRRKLIASGNGVYEAHVGLPFLPQFTQPTRSIRTHDPQPDTENPLKLTFSTDLRTTHPIIFTDLKSVDPAVYECLDDDTKLAIKAQIHAESV